MEKPKSSTKEARKRLSKCVFCNKTFHRSDILRRHYGNCLSRGNAPIPQPLKRGKRRRACDACSRSKLACDFDSPCETCLMHRLPCTYTRKDQEASQNNILPINLQSTTDSSTVGNMFGSHAVGEINKSVLAAVTRIPRSRRPVHQRKTQHTSSTGRQSPKPFLLTYIDPKVKSVPETFGYTADSSSEDTESHAGASTDAGDRVNHSLPRHPVMLQSTPFDFNEVSTFLQPETWDDQQLLNYFFAGQSPSNSSCPEDDQSWFAEPLPAHWTINNRLTDDLMYHLHDFCANLPAGNPESEPNNNLAECLDLISPSNIAKFVNLYFHHWNRHSPVIHRATFDPGTASLPLLFAIIVTGALFSSADDVAKARRLLNLAEEYAFQSKAFTALLAGTIPNNYDEEHRSHDALQAAFSVAQVQLREGSAPARKHARSTRFGQVIIAVRTAGLMQSRNKSFTLHKEEGSSFKWMDFGDSEAKIRLMCGLFALDTSFMLFYNMPPRISLEEFKIDMPCSPECYFASDAETCQEAIRAQLGSRPPPINGIMMLYLGHPEVQSSTKSFTVIYFFVLVLALLRRIWALPLNEIGVHKAHICRALLRWKSDWDRFLAEMTPQQSELSGFSKQAAIEFWHLSNIILAQLS